MTGDRDRVALITAGQAHTCGLEADGTAWCWGCNGSGSWATARTTDKPTPVAGRHGRRRGAAPAHRRRLPHVRAGRRRHRLVLGQQRLRAARRRHHHAPTAHPGPGAGTGTGWTTLNAGAFPHVRAGTTDGTAWCWGYNGYGQLGDGTTTTASHTGAGHRHRRPVTQLTAGDGHTCGLARPTAPPGAGASTTPGSSATAPPPTSPLRCRSPAPVDSPLTAGNGHTCGLTTDGTAWCWGSSFYGQLGDGTTTDKSTPVQVTGTGWTTLNAGHGHTCGLKPGAPPGAGASTIPASSATAPLRTGLHRCR